MHFGTTKAVPAKQVWHFKQSLFTQKNIRRGAFSLSMYAPKLTYQSSCSVALTTRVATSCWHSRVLYRAAASVDISSFGYPRLTSLPRSTRQTLLRSRALGTSAFPAIL